MTRIKICGVTTPDDAGYAADCGADAIGLNFYSKSPRFLSDDQAAEIVRNLPPYTAAVGVFVGDPADVVRAKAERLGLRGVQTYPNELIRFDYFPSSHIAAFRVKDAGSLVFVRQYVALTRPTAVLVDSYVPGEMGGTGHRAPWELLVGFDPGVPVILAGGLTPDNVGEAIRQVQPWGVDVASGVEATPGRKDSAKVRDFVQAVRSVNVNS